MPPRAEPGDRERIEAALGPQLREALRSLCATLGIPVDRWQEVSALQQIFSTVAVVRLAAAYENVAERQALERAAYSLGHSPDTILSRLRRWGETS